MWLKLLTCAALALTPAAALAQGRPLTESSSFTDTPPATDDRSTEDLVRECGGQGPPGRAGVPGLACTRYLDGMLSMHALMVGFGAKPEFCLPTAGIRLDAARLAFLERVTADPASLEQSARINVLIALRQTFPCQPEPPPERKQPRRPRRR